jgi:hypothetical protein
MKGFPSLPQERTNKVPTKKAKKASAKNSANSTESAKAIVFTGNAIVITLDAAAQKKAKQCLQKSGRITFSVKEHSATRLPQILDNGEKID